MSLYDNEPAHRASGNRFALDRMHGKVLGVCAGIAAYFDVDVTLVRIAWVLATICGFGSLVLVYLAIALIAD